MPTLIKSSSAVPEMTESTLPGSGCVVTRRVLTEEQRKAARESNARYRQRNPDRDKAYYEKNKAQIQEAWRQQYAENRQEIRAAVKARYASAEAEVVRKAGREAKQAAQAEKREARSLELGRPIITQAEARLAGSEQYFTGKPCKHGHLASRITKNSQCVLCVPRNSALWRAENKTKHAAIQKEWATRNREARRAFAANRRARELAGGTHTAKDLTWLMKVQGGKCAHTWCRKDLRTGYHVDHVMPLARGGSNGRNNLQLLCQHCNISKRAKHPVDYALEHGLLV